MTFWWTVAAVMTGGLLLLPVLAVGFYVFAWASYWIAQVAAPIIIWRAKRWVAKNTPEPQRNGGE